MIIKFKTLRLYNFLSFGDTEVNLDDSGYTLVSGINNCKADLAKSNGSGKSSLWEGIVWCLTGTTIRGTKNIVNKYGTDGTFVELTFDIDKDQYKLIRYKDYSNIGTNLKIFINNVDKSGKGIRDSEKLLEQYLPDLTGSLIGSVIILGQGLPQRFTNNTPSGRKEVLEKLSKSDFMIDDIKQRLSNRKQTLSTELRKFEDEILSLESKKSVVQSQLDRDEMFLKEQPVIDFANELTEYENTISHLKADAGSYDVKLKESELKGKEIADRYNKFDLDFKDWQYQNAIEYSEKTNPLTKEKIQNAAKISQLNTEINKAKNIKDVCPTCGQKLVGIHKIDTTDMETEVEQLTKLNKDLDLQIQALKDESNSKEEDFKKSQEQEKQAVKQQLDIARSEYKELLAQRESLNQEIKAKEIAQINLIHTRDRLLNIQNTIEQNKQQLEQYNEAILYNNISKDDKKSRYDIVNKMLTIATRDFRGFLLSEVINFIDRKAKEYCKEIFETEEIEFKLDGNDIYIGYCGKQYEALSGGEKQKVDLIVQFSIRDMLSQFLNFSSNILVVDEICDNLDSIGCQRVLNMISTKLTDVSSLFIITHHTNELAIPFDNEITVVKDDNGISKVL